MRVVSRLGRGLVVATVVLGALGILTSCDREAPPAAATPPPAESVAAGAAPPSATTPASHRQEFLAIAARLTAGDNPYFGTGALDAVRAELAGGQVGPERYLELRQEESGHLLRLGRVMDAVQVIDQTMLWASQRGIEPPPPALHHSRAVAYLRQAEVFNCVQRHNPECCIFPLAGGAVHTVKKPAIEARRSLLAALDTAGSDEPDLGRVWLLNVVSQAIGDWPDAVPTAYRLPSQAFASTYDIGRFRDVAGALDLDAFDLCGGAIAEDIDGDGWIDLVTSTSDPTGPLRYHRNRGDGGFEDRSAASRIDDQLGGLNIVAGDYDGDGDPDVLVLRGAWMMADGHIRNSLLRNDAGVFIDVTAAAGIAQPALPTQTAAWADYDNDGDLDLYVGNEWRADVDPVAGDFPNQLWANDGDGTFTDVTRQAGVENRRYTKGVAWGDYDNDGDLDLHVSNIGPNRLYRNDGNGTFNDVAAAAGVTAPTGRSFATWWFDFDNDGWLDLFVAAFEATIADMAADALGRAHQAAYPRLYRNNRDGTFTDIAQEAGLHHPYLPMGANFGDLDHDGWLDVYLTTGDPSFETLVPNVMLRNDQGQRFQDVTTAGGFGHLQKGHGVAFADFDHDGDQDIFNQLGGFVPGDKFRNALYQNPGRGSGPGGNHFLYVRLHGISSHPSAIGARIEVVVSQGPTERHIHRAVGAVSSFGGSPLRQEIGLGPCDRIERVTIRWPRSPAQMLTGVPLDASIRVTEGAEGFLEQPLQPVQLGR